MNNKNLIPIKKSKLLALAMALLMNISFTYAQSGAIQAGENIAVVSTEYGKVRGFIDDGIFSFKGIPYAKAERFMPPQTPDLWDEVRQCTIYGPQAMQGKAQDWGGQSDNNFGFHFNVEDMDEQESFVLNVWSKGINDGKKRPVWVWIHGGGFASGSSNQLSFYEGRAMAEKGDIVVVSVNHRLNLLGYIDLRGLGGKYSESVNLGMQDLVFALEWVRDNISNFGGNPNTVTIAGQSGGGGKVNTLLMMPSADGLFQRAIIQSGSLAVEMRGEDSKAFGLAFAAALGVTPNNTEKLNDFTYEELLKAGQVASDVMGPKGNSIMGRYAPTVDGKYLIGSPLIDPPADFSKDIPLLVGSNLNEFTYHNRAIITQKSMQEVKARLTNTFGEKDSQKLIDLYKKAYPNDEEPQHILTFDSMLRSGAINQVDSKYAQNGAPVYAYLFTWQSPVNDGSLGAAHGMELPFMFNNIAKARTLTGGGKDAYELADKISSAWINFIKTGDPNAKGLPNWPKYNPEDGATMIFDNKCKVVKNHDKELIEFVDTLPPLPLFGSR
ncbi:carboxylesterase/lipase family protein [Flagellimonas sp. GZD32]|uniref:carboxylesterase/lipase family protein n=1 Tax=Flagellimonas cixiensis TaxID=3228750 RepID=UPI0035C8ACB1